MKLTNMKALVLDFDGIFTDDRTFLFPGPDGSRVEGVFCSHEDGAALSRLRLSGRVKLAVLSSNSSPYVRLRAEKLRIPLIAPSVETRAALSETDWPTWKLDKLKTLANDWQLPLSAFGYAGNDAHDLLCLSAVGYPIMPFGCALWQDGCMNRNWALAGEPGRDFIACLVRCIERTAHALQVQSPTP